MLCSQVCGSRGVIFVCDATNEGSVQAAVKALEYVEREDPGNALVKLMVINKTDLMPPDSLEVRQSLPFLTNAI